MSDEPTLIAEMSIRQEVLPLRMICGCLLRSSDPFVQDDEGFVICPTHEARRYGWRSVPYRRDAMGAWSPLMYEEFVLFGQYPVLTTWDEVKNAAY